MPQPLEWGTQEFLELTQVPWVAVGCRSLEVIPDEFVGVELRCIPRKAVRMQTRMSAEELPDRRPLMVVAAIPQQDYVATQVFGQLPEESDHFGRADVLL